MDDAGKSKNKTIIMSFIIAILLGIIIWDFGFRNNNSSFESKDCEITTKENEVIENNNESIPNNDIVNDPNNYTLANFKCDGFSSQNCSGSFNGISVQLSNNIDNKVSFIINGKDVSKSINRMSCYSYSIVSDLVIAECNDTSGGSTGLFIFNSKGLLLKSFDKFDNGYLFNDYVINNDNENIYFLVVSSVSIEETLADIDGKSLFDMNCTELKKYKDLPVKYYYDLKYLGNSKFSEIKESKSDETIESDKDFYEWLLENCRENQ